jgi:glucose-6-phosphate 1-dehydrogenase
MSRPQPEPLLFVIMGGTGDLTSRKLLPALHALSHKDLLNEKTCVLGVSRSRELDDESYRAWARKVLSDAGLEPEGSWCDRCLHFSSIGEGKAEDYEALARHIGELEEREGLPGNRAFYLSLPAQAFAPTIEGLGGAQLGSSAGWTRIVIEKPFGRDLASARDLNATVHKHFAEDQVYRIDHYLGKETVQNLLVFRFGNAIFEDLWNRDRIESVQITVAESLGVEKRGAFYETVGALRDVFQNHLLQVLALVGMEVPMTYGAEAVHHEKLKVLNSIRVPEPEDVVWGQYVRGRSGDQELAGYREEEGIAGDSQIETYVAMRLAVDNWRWQGVPFFLRTGKRLDRKLTRIAVSFRQPPVCLFESMGSCLLHHNDLLITLQPDEGFSLLMDVKAPGIPLSLARIPLHFSYAEAFGKLPEAYETLLLDVLEGDQTLFVHADEVEASWQICDPLLQQPRELQEYAAGTSGPKAADWLLARDGHMWVRE